MIYLDNAATTIRKPDGVAEAVSMAVSSFGNASRGTHEGAFSAGLAILSARKELAALFHCPKSDQVVFTMNSTEALNIAIFGTLASGDHVISTDLEHNSVLRPLYALCDAGTISVDFVPADERGSIDYVDFERLLKPNTRAIVCTHASNLTGDVLDIRRIGRFAHAHGLLMIVDASQTAGVFPIDLMEDEIDILCFTGHKSLMGPQGTGGLCIRPGIEVTPLLYGGTGVQSYLREQPYEYPTRLEAGTLNSHGIAGLLAALEFIKATGSERIAARERALSDRFYAGVRDTEGIQIYGHPDAPLHAPIVSLNIRRFDSSMVADALYEIFGIAVRSGSHCAPRLHNALRTRYGAVRFSFSYFNTEEEVDEAVHAVQMLNRELF